jgi:CRAL/TRIO domain
MYKITTADRMLRNLVTEYEKLADPRLPACARKAGKLLETCCTIMDLKGVGLSKASSVYGYVKSASAISQNYYPERLGRLYIINAPWGFSSVFNFVKGFLDPVTVEKIHVLGGGYQSELLGQVPKENLPKQFGGTCECQGGCALSDAGPWQDPKWAKPPKWAQAPQEQGEKKEEKKVRGEEAVIDQEKLNEGVKGMDTKDRAEGQVGEQKPIQPEQPAAAAAAAPQPSHAESGAAPTHSAVTQ